MARSCPACHHEFEADALAGVVCCPRCARSFDIAMDSTAITDSSSKHWSAVSGTYFARHLLKRKIGQGGMSEVWAAEKDERELVIKILLPHVAANEQIRKRFRREIDSLQRFQHPRIIPIIDHGEANGRLYYVTDVLAKQSLRQRMDQYRRKPPSAVELHHLASDCLSALAHAHDKNIIHRDIKPENILERDDGTYALSDFGIAQVHSTHDGDTLTMLTNTNVVLGTYAYMAPEQGRASRDIDARADLYALGVVLYECISGHLPEGRFEDPEVFMSGWSAQDRSLWNNFILCLLERDPAKRYADAHMALRALNDDVPKQAAAQHTPQQANPYPHGHQLYRFARYGWFGGVCSGLGRWSGIDAGWIRLAMCLGLLFTGGIMFIAYIVTVVLLPNCPDPDYRPRPLNAGLPQRGNGWFLGVCEMLGQRSSSPEVWRLIFVLLCFFSGFTLVLPYLAIGILFPASEKRMRRVPTQRHIKQIEAAPGGEPRPSLWPSFLSALPAALGFGLMTVMFLDKDQMPLAAIFGGFTVYFMSQLHTRGPLTPVNFRGFGSGLTLAGLAMLIGMPFLELSQNTALINNTGSISGGHVEDALLLSYGAIALGLLWGLLRGYYGPLAQIIGAMPVMLLLTLPHYPQLQLPFIKGLAQQPLTFLSVALVLWLVSASITQSILRWIVNAPEDKPRHYSLSASIIGVAVIMACILVGSLQARAIHNQYQAHIDDTIRVEREQSAIFTTSDNARNRIDMNDRPHVINQHNQLVPIDGREVIVIDGDSNNGNMRTEDNSMTVESD